MYNPIPRIFFLVGAALSLFVLVKEAGAQGLVNADMYRGRATLSIPLTSIQKGGIAVPVSLEYAAAGVKVSEGEGKPYGLGWSLVASGSIRRQLADLPDDKLSGGWLNNNSGNLALSFNIANDGNASSCSDEAADINHLNSNFPVGTDSEPDIFNVTAPGLSCKLVFDKNRVPQIIPYKDLKVSYTTDGYGINTFTLINDQGVSYYFANAELMTRHCTEATLPLAFYSREYHQYSTQQTFYSRWHLQHIKDASGNVVTFEYTDPEPGEPGATKTEVMLPNGSGGLTKKTLYSVSTTSQPRYLKKIISGITADVVFSYAATNSITGLLSSIILKNGQALSIQYHTNSTIPDAAGNSTQRAYLRRIASSGCDAQPPFEFYYHSVNYGSNESPLPASDSRQQDLWGYYNAGSDTQLTPQVYVYPPNASYPNLERYRLTPVPGYTGTWFTLPGANRAVNPSVVMCGTLTKIENPMGGSTLLEYEPNRYYDANAQAEYNGGGIRIKKITESDGMDPSKDMVREFIYTLPGSSTSSGKTLHLPSFAFTRPYNGTPGTQAYWENATIRSENDLSGRTDRGCLQLRHRPANRPWKDGI
ncbi:hypothetical protein BDE36_0269 [Arcticibacter tournemirensis]|uniref:hypothetical protein n=1 Tax=Arcticibacter tournemirensis TaxID=699437 RepID=UPI00116A41D9|nr:hypothetical protein [Arcticibacter tournemirensis]TQM48582.1 hypothetical protein BDE36_0269 [Arcticibacter tournemirensis]